MGQKVNPISLRLQKTNRHFDSCWYDDYNYTHLLLQDLKIKNYLKTVLHQIKYPESRIINYGVPKKNTYNLFYYNPSNSRRKKDYRFQLQNFKEKAYGAGASNLNKYGKGAFGRKIRKINEKDIHSFFSFPKQQHWDYNTFSLAQRQIESVAAHITPVDENRQLHSNQTTRWKKNENPSSVAFGDVFFSLSKPKENLFLFDKNIYPTPTFNRKTSFTFQRFPEGKFFISPKGNQRNVQDVRDDTLLNLSDKSKISLREIFYFPEGKSKNCSSIIKKADLSHITHTLFGKESFLYVNQLLLEFVIKNNRTLSSNNIFEGRDKVNNRNNLKNLDSERLFVRYLLAQFYCNYLQNKEKYNAESVSTLYRFLVFFQEKNVEHGTFLKKYKKFLYRSDDTHNSGITNITDITIIAKGDLTGNVKNSIVENVKGYRKRDIKGGVSNAKRAPLFYRSGVYSSKLLYKTYLEHSISKQYSSFFNINLFRTLIEKQSASFIVEEIVHYLERKIPFRRIKTQILKEIPQYTNIKGIRIKCSGRVGGRSKKAQRSKTQSVKIGQTSLGVFSSKIDFACKSAYTRFGLIGIKVWVCYN